MVAIRLPPSALSLHLIQPLACLRCPCHTQSAKLGLIDVPPTHFQVLQLGGNQVASISSLQLGGLSSLRSLFLQNNDITRVDGLAGLVNLQVRSTLDSLTRGKGGTPLPLSSGEFADQRGMCHMNTVARCVHGRLLSLTTCWHLCTIVILPLTRSWCCRPLSLPHHRSSCWIATASASSTRTRSWSCHACES